MTNKEELREKIKHSFVRYHKYLSGPVPSDLLYGSPDKEPMDVVLEEVMHLIDEQTRAARVDELNHAFIKNVPAFIEEIDLEKYWNDYYVTRSVQLSKDKDNHA